jgi:site-specific DNA recombinase
MSAAIQASPKRCAVYCRVSSDECLDQSFNSIDAQKEAGHAFIKSQPHEGWIAVADDYDDGAFSGGNMERPALKRLLADIEASRIDIVVVSSATRSPPARPRACGWAGRCRWVTPRRTACWSSTRRKRR